MKAESEQREPAGSHGQFPATHWSCVLSAGAQDSSAAAAALETLCRDYWKPLFFFAQRRGHSAADAQDLTQDFVARLIANSTLAQAHPARGRFRSFLLTSFDYFMANEWRKGNAQKRGGGRPVLSMNDTAAEGRYSEADLSGASPEALYDREWAEAILGQAMAALRAEMQGDGRRLEVLLPYLTGEEREDSYAALGEKLGSSEGAARVAVHRLRKRYAEVLRGVIRETVGSADDVEDEIRHLFSVLNR